MLSDNDGIFILYITYMGTECILAIGLDCIDIVCTVLIPYSFPYTALVFGVLY